MGKIQIFKTSTLFGKRFYFRLKADNGEIVAVSEAYNSKKACENGIELLRSNANSDIVDLTK
jgi:uncharacterized protein YegP (UPF0339 family)